MSKKGGTQVTPVDPWEAGRADATFNRIDSYTPFGSLTYSGPNRNIANLDLHPYLEGNESRRMISDRMGLDMALGRQASMQQTGLPSLTEGIHPGAMQEFFGLPTYLQSGYDFYPTPDNIPNLLGPPPSGPYRQGDDPSSQYYDGDYGAGQMGAAEGGSPSGFEQQPSQAKGGGLEDFGQLDRNRVEQSYFDRTSSLLDPQYERAEERLYQSLADRGIPLDSDLGRDEIAQFERNRGETYGRLANDSVLQGGGEQSRLFGMADLLGQRDIQVQLQNANLAQSNRATQFNELAALLGMQQVASPGLNNFFQPGNVDMMGAYALNQQGQMANAQNAANRQGGLMGALGQLGGAALGNWGEIFS